MSDNNTLTLDLPRFWNLVAEVNWASTEVKGIDSNDVYRHGKRVLMSKLAMGEARAFSDILDRLTGALAKAVKAWERDHDQDCDLYGDGWGDFLNHVVGCGREVYERELADPSLAFKRATSHRFEESFSYCVPGPDDYEMRDGDLLPTRACEYLEGLEGAPEGAMGEVEKGHMSTLREFLGAVANGYAETAAASQGDAVVEAMKHLRPWQRHRDSAHFREAEGFAPALSHWGIDNMVSDIRQVF